MTDYKPYYTHVDKLQLKFQTINFQYFFDNTDGHFQIKPTNKNSDYQFTFEILFIPSGSLVPVVLCVINLGYIHNTQHSCIILANYALYTQNWLPTLLIMIDSLNLPRVFIKEIEIAKDTNTEITVKYARQYINDKITYKKNYDDPTFFGTMKLLKKSTKNQLRNLTYYIKHPSKKRNNDRIECKTNEIHDKSKKFYIFDYLADHIDTTKTIYRFEKTLLSCDLTHKNRVYVSKYGEVITATAYSKLNEVEKTDYISRTETSHLDIDFNKLTDPLYLDSVFEHFAIFNYAAILPPSKAIKIFKACFVKTYSTRPKKIIPSNVIDTKRQSEIRHHIKLLQTELVYCSSNILKAKMDILFNTSIDLFESINTSNRPDDTE